MENKVGIILISTRKYDIFLQPLIDSMEEFFLKGEPYDIYLFTDKPEVKLESTRGIIHRRAIPSYAFPFATLYRYKTMVKNIDVFTSRYLFYLDVDMRLVSEVGDEMLGSGLTVVQHPGYFNGGWGSRKTHPSSISYLPPSMWHDYYCGGTQGGTTEEYLEMAKILNEAIDIDMDTAQHMGYTKNDGILAEWHDESFYNWYIKTHAGPLHILTPSYCYPESWNIPFEKKILALDKNHKEIRS